MLSFSTCCQIGFPVVGLILGIVIGFFFKKKIHEEKIKLMQQQFKEIAKLQTKKIFAAIGKKPSEEQINRILTFEKKT